MEPLLPPERLLREPWCISRRRAEVRGQAVGSSPAERQASKGCSGGEPRKEAAPLPGRPCGARIASAGARQDGALPVLPVGSHESKGNRGLPTPTCVSRITPCLNATSPKGSCMGKVLLHLPLSRPQLGKALAGSGKPPAGVGALCTRPWHHAAGRLCCRHRSDRRG